MSSHEIKLWFDKIDWIEAQSLALELHTIEWDILREAIKIGLREIRRELEKESGIKNEQNRKS